jgi:hypothetical protein
MYRKWVKKTESRKNEILYKDKRYSYLQCIDKILFGLQYQLQYNDIEFDNEINEAQELLGILMGTLWT